MSHELNLEEIKHKFYRLGWQQLGAKSNNRIGFEYKDVICSLDLHSERYRSNNILCVYGLFNRELLSAYHYFQGNSFGEKGIFVDFMESVRLDWSSNLDDEISALTITVSDWIESIAIDKILMAKNNLGCLDEYGTLVEQMKSLSAAFVLKDINMLNEMLRLYNESSSFVPAFKRDFIETAIENFDNDKFRKKALNKKFLKKVIEPVNPIVGVG